MITHNGKQVTLAMRNRKAINLIARNGKAMFGEYVNWQNAYIDAAAKAVILAEYGKQVWSDVRDYAKAHPQIVEFINQDPHLAASISPNSNKERWLVGDGELRSETSFQKGVDLDVQIEFISNNTTSVWGTIFWQGSAQGGNDSIFMVGFNGSTSKGYAYIGKQNYYSSITYTNGKKMTLRLKNQEGFWFDGHKAWSTTKLSSNLIGQLIIGGGYNKSIGNLFCKDTDNSIDWNFVPFVGADGVPCLLDINSCQERMLPTTDQFTIAITDKE